MIYGKFISFMTTTWRFLDVITLTIELVDYLFSQCVSQTFIFNIIICSTEQPITQWGTR